MTRYRDRYEEIYALLSRAELQKGSRGLEELSAGPELFGSNDRWLGFYTDEGVRIALQKYGFFRDLQRRGFNDLRIETDTHDPDCHLLRLWSHQPDADEPLIELTVRRNFLNPDAELAGRIGDTHLPVLTVDWLLMQNPLASFTPDRPPLPGQSHPGLGVGAQVLELLRNICHRLGLDGILTVPSYFHNAMFYSHEFRHFDPQFEGIFQALHRDIVPAVDDSVAAATWALEWHMVRERSSPDTAFEWFHQLMVNPVSERLKTYFDAPDYTRETRDSRGEHRFDVRCRPLFEKLRRRGIAPFDSERLEHWID